MTRWLERLFLLLIASLGFGWPGVDVSGYRTTATDLVFLIVGAILVAAWVMRKKRVRFDRLYLYLGVFAAVMALSAAFSVSPGTSAVKFAGVLYLVGLAVLTFNVIDSAKAMKATVIVWIGTSTLVCLIGVVTIALFYIDRSNYWHTLFLHHYGSLPVGNYPRIQSTFLYPAMLCNYLTVGVMMVLAAMKLDWIGKKLTVVLVILHAAAAIFTFTPGLGGFLFAIAAWFGLELIERGLPFPGKLTLAAGAAVFILSVAASAFSIWPISTSPFTFDAFGMRIDPTQRLLAWRDAAATFLEYPIFGKGLGLGVAQVLFKAPSGQMQMLTDAHNTFLNVAGQAGILGLASIVALIAAVVKRGVSAIAAGNRTSPLILALTIAFVSGLVMQGLVGSFEDARHLWVLMGSIAAAAIGQTETDHVS